MNPGVGGFAGSTALVPDLVGAENEDGCASTLGAPKTNVGQDVGQILESGEARLPGVDGVAAFLRDIHQYPMSAAAKMSSMRFILAVS